MKAKVRSDYVVGLEQVYREGTFGKEGTVSVQQNGMMTASEKAQLRRCSSSFVCLCVARRQVTATYDNYASFLKIRAPCIWSLLLMPCRDSGLPFHIALRADRFQEFPEYAHEVYYANGLAIPSDQLLAKPFLKQHVDGLIHLIVLLQRGT